MLRRLALAALFGAVLAACGANNGGGGGGGGGGNPAGPSGPAAPPTTDVSGYWTGTASDSTGVETVFWQLTLAGNSVTGSGSRSGANPAAGGDHGLTVTGTLSGDSLTFTVKWGSNCVRTVTGTATAAATSITGSYSGSACGTIANGRLTLARIDMSGTWAGGMSDLRPGVGPGRFARNTTWRLTESGDTVTGTMTNPDPLSPDVPITGTFSVASSTLTFTATYTVLGNGTSCAETISGTAKVDLAFAPGATLSVPNALITGTYSGSSCFTAINGGGVNLTRNGT